MLPKDMIGGFFEHIVVRALKFPIVYLLIGLVLVLLSYIDNFIPLTHFQHMFDLTDKIGRIFISFALITFIYNLVALSCFWFEKKLASEHHLAAVLLSSIRKGLRIIFILVVINMVITILAPNPFYLMLANNTINTIIIGSIGWIAIQILYAYEALIYQKMMAHTDREHILAKTLYTKTHIFRNITTVVIIIVTIAAIMMSFDSVRSIGISLLASAGFLTAIIGLSAQKTLVSLFSGLQIALSQVIRIGDIIMIDNHSGTIEEITFTYITLKLADRRRLIVPINFLAEKPFENWSREGDSLRSSIRLFIDYMLPIAPLRSQLEKILKNSHLWDGQACKLQVANLTDRSVEIRMQISAANGDNLSDLRAEVQEKMLEFISEKYPDHFPKVRLNNENNASENDASE